MANLSARTGTSPSQTRISLSNNATSFVQNFDAYESQSLEGHVFIDATTDYRASVKLTIIKNGLGVYEIAASDIAGDDNGGSPIVDFSMSGSNLIATLVDYPGFASAYIQYNLTHPIQGLGFPLTVDAASIGSGVLDSARLPLATSTAAGAIPYYEENDAWNPNAAAAANLSGTLVADSARYTRLGRMIMGSFRVTGVTHVADGTPTAISFDAPIAMGDNNGQSAVSVGGTGRVLGPSAGRVIPAVSVDASSSNNNSLIASWESDTSIGSLTTIVISFYYTL